MPNESCVTCNDIQTTFADEIGRGASYRCSRCGKLIERPPAAVPPPPAYWLLVGEVPTGPFSVAEVHARLAAGEATWQTPASPVGGAKWLPLVETPGIGPGVAGADGATPATRASPSPSRSDCPRPSPRPSPCHSRPRRPRPHLRRMARGAMRRGERSSGCWSSRYSSQRSASGRTGSTTRFAP